MPDTILIQKNHYPSKIFAIVFPKSLFFIYFARLFTISQKLLSKLYPERSCNVSVTFTNLLVSYLLMEQRGGNTFQYIILKQKWFLQQNFEVIYWHKKYLKNYDLFENVNTMLYDPRKKVILQLHGIIICWTINS